MNKETIQARIETISDEADKKYGELAEVYRREVLIPFCKKYHLDFRSDPYWGYSFSHSDSDSEFLNGEILQNPEFLSKMPKSFVNQLGQICSDLDIPVKENGIFCLSGYIDNISFKKES